MEAPQPYKPSPRPTFDGPAHIPYRSVQRYLWGDPVAGEVSDWIYVSSERIHALVFGLPPHGAFRHSPNHRTVFAADELLYVLEGTMAIANPETGEVQRIETGESVFFRRDTWHHAFAHGAGPLRVLELFAPPPGHRELRGLLPHAAVPRGEPLRRRQPARHAHPGQAERAGR